MYYIKTRPSVEIIAKTFISTVERARVRGEWAKESEESLLVAKTINDSSLEFYIRCAVRHFRFDNGGAGMRESSVIHFAK